MQEFEINFETYVGPLKINQEEKFTEIHQYITYNYLCIL